MLGMLGGSGRPVTLVPPERVAAAGGVVELAFELPMPTVSYLELAP